MPKSESCALFAFPFVDSLWFILSLALKRWFFTASAGFL